jgi:hypothetical protein
MSTRLYIVALNQISQLKGYFTAHCLVILKMPVYKDGSLGEPLKCPVIEFLSCLEEVCSIYCKSHNNSENLIIVIIVQRECALY